MCGIRGSASGLLDERLALVIPHFDFQGNMIDWWSARLIETGLRTVTSFNQLVVQGKTLCPPFEPPRAYIPPMGSYSFTKGQRVYIHESAIKAINGAKIGGCHIGLNGVWGWTSRKHGIALVQELRDLPWKRLELNPFIVFDSNWEDNDQVRLAIARLGAKLQEITGRVAMHLPLPRAADGSHQGFDDFCVATSELEARAYLDGDGQAIDIGDIEMLKLQLNNEVCVVRSLGRIAEQETGTLMTRGTFTDVTYAHYTAALEDDENGRIVNVPKLWLQDARRTEVERIDYLPGNEDRICGEEGHKILNTWSGWGVAPAPGDVALWLDILERNVVDEGLRKWIIQWFAYPLQHPGQKLNTYLHLWGPPGSGKNAILEPLLRLYGKNGTVCDKDTLGSNFNAIIANKQFVNFDELHGGSGPDAQRIINKLKPLVTRETVDIEPKGVDKYQIRNCMNIVTTANPMDALKLDDGDRRAAVIRIADGSHNNDRAYWTPYWAWAQSDEGAAALFAHLLNVDLQGFDPKGWAPMTDDKLEMTKATKRFDEQWVHMLKEDPAQVLPPILKTRALMTTDELAQYCFTEGTATAGQKNALGIKLYAADFNKVELKIEGRKVRFWVIRNVDAEWTPEACRKHLKAHKYPGA